MLREIAGRLRLPGVRLIAGMLACVYLFFCGLLFLSLFTAEQGVDTEIGRLTFPTRIPCTPVSDQLNPPLYPNAQQVSVVHAATPQWLGVMFTRSFHTTDSATAVLDFYRDTMAKEGWTPEFQLSEELKAPGASKSNLLEPELANMPDVVDVLGFAAFCGTTSAHPIRVYVVVRSPENSHTQVDLRVY